MQTVVKSTENQGKATSPKTPFFGSGGSTPFFQEKLTVNKPGDKYEQEADAVADQVMRMRDGDTPVVQRMPLSAVSHLQRECKSCEEETGEAPQYMVQRKCAGCEQEDIQRTTTETSEELEEPGVQRKSSVEAENEAPDVSRLQGWSRNGIDVSGRTAPPIVDSVLKSGQGRPLESGVRGYMESRMGLDFSGVRIHVGQRAAESAASIQAKAYTSGQSVVFGAGQYKPETESGKRLLAHELAHVGQQNGGIMRQETAPTEPKPAEPAPASGSQEAGAAPSACQNYAPAEVSAEGSAGTEVTEIPGNESEKKPAPDVPSGKEASKPEAAKPETAKPEDSKPETEGGAEKTGQSAISPKDPKEDPAFQNIVVDTKKAKNSQEKHEAGETKAAEAELSAENPQNMEAQKADASKLLNVNDAVNTNPDSHFDKQAFKAEVLKLVEKEIPETEGEHKEFKETGEQRVKDIGSGAMAQAPNPERNVMTQPASESNLVSGDQNALYQKEVAPVISEDPGKKAAIGDSPRAIPKPHTNSELALDPAHDAESLDKAMEDENLKEFDTKMTEGQLANSDEPQFLDTLAVKKEEQAKLCQVPATLRKEETDVYELAVQKAQKNLADAQKDKHDQRKDKFSKINAGKEEAKLKDELLLANYYKKIAGIYKNVKTGVDEILKNLDETIPTIFGDAVTKANAEFKKRVKSRLDDYYGVGITNLSEEDEDAYERYYNEPINNNRLLAKVNVS